MVEQEPLMTRPSKHVVTYVNGNPAIYVGMRCGLGNCHLVNGNEGL